MVQVEQNLGICIGLSAVGGILEVFATAILAYPDAQAKEGNPWTNRTLRVCLVANIFFQVLASIIGNLFAPWFGPVSIVGPIFLSAQLVANMIIYGSLLGLESFTKDMRIGTAVIVTAAMLLPVVGPGILEYEDKGVRDLLHTWWSYVLNIVLLVAMMITAMALLIFKLCCSSEKQQRFQQRNQGLLYVILLTARATSFTINLSYSKVLVLDPSTVGLVVSIVLKVISGAIMTGAIVVQSTTVQQNTFVPLNATCIIAVNALTGIIIWEDWRVVQSWLGYVTVFVQLVIGNYLLLGEIDLFSPSNRRYGRTLLLRRIAGRRDLCFEDEYFASSALSLRPANNKNDTPGVGGSAVVLGQETGPFSSNKDDRQSGKLPVAHDDSQLLLAQEWMAANATPVGDSVKIISTDEEVASATEAGRLGALDEKPNAISNVQRPTQSTPPGLYSSESKEGDANGSGIPAAAAAAMPDATTTTASSSASGDAQQQSHPPRLPPLRPPPMLRASTTGELPSSSPTALLPPRPQLLTQRSQTTGTGLSTRQQQQQGEDRRAQRMRRSQVRKSAWGQVLGVDERWLERRASHRHLERIIEQHGEDLR